MDLVLFGIQGSGKGTQAKKLAKEKNYYIFEAGGELRKIAATDTDLGRTVKSYIDEGKLVPHEIIMRVMAEAVRGIPKDQKIIFDGIPRDENQMKDFDAIMKSSARPFQCLHFVLEKDKAIERILGRAKQEGRVDDANTDIILKRMQTFLDKTMPVIKTYEANGLMTDVNADRNVDQVYDNVKKVLLG